MNDSVTFAGFDDDVHVGGETCDAIEAGNNAQVHVMVAIHARLQEDVLLQVLSAIRKHAVLQSAIKSKRGIFITYIRALSHLEK